MGSHSSHVHDAAYALFPVRHPLAHQPRRLRATPAHHVAAPRLASPPAYHQSASIPSQCLAHTPRDAAFGRVFSPPGLPVPPTGAPHYRLSRYPPHTPVTQAISRLSWSLLVT